MRTAKMTPTEGRCLEVAARSGGELNKLTFGLWHGVDHHDTVHERTSFNGFSTQTVQRLVDRGLMKFVGQKRDKAILVCTPHEQKDCGRPDCEVCQQAFPHRDPFKEGCLNVDLETMAKRDLAGRCTECGHDRTSEPIDGHAVMCPTHPARARDRLERALEDFRSAGGSAHEVVEALEEFIKRGV